MAYISIDPYRQTELGRWPSDTDEQLIEKINLTHSDWRHWKNTSVNIRAGLLEKLATILEARRQTYAAIITSEMGKPVSQSLAEVDKCGSLCRYYASNLGDLLIEKSVPSGAASSTVRLDPQGIILGIMPWNFPFWQVFRYLVPALAGANAAVLKHASNVTLSAFAIRDAIRESGFPSNLFNVLLPDHSQMEKIISLPAIRGVTLTGSNSAGSAIASMSGRYIKKSVLELGGSDPLIVFADADISNAAKGAVTGRFQNCGQSCIAAKRILVHSNVFDAFMADFLALVRKMKMGDPSDPDVFIGPMVNSPAVSEINRQVTRSVAMGAVLLEGGRVSDLGPAFYEPAVMVSVPNESPVISEEVFGPVAPVMVFSDTEEAVSTANSSRFGLGASVWTRDRRLACEVAASLDTGTVAVNGFVRSDPALPFGGVKDSGYGRELASEGFKEFLNIKSVSHY